MARRSRLSRGYGDPGCASRKRSEQLVIESFRLADERLERRLLDRADLVSEGAGDPFQKALHPTRHPSEHRVDDIVLFRPRADRRIALPRCWNGGSIHDEIVENERFHLRAAKAEYGVHDGANDRFAAQVEGRVEEDRAAGTPPEMLDQL